MSRQLLCACHHVNRVLATELHSRQQRGALLPQRSPSPVPDHQLDASLGRSLQGLVALVCAPAGAVLPVDLQDLVPEAQAGQGGGRVGLHQLHKQTLGGGSEERTGESTGYRRRGRRRREGWRREERPREWRPKPASLIFNAVMHPGRISATQHIDRRSIKSQVSER